MGSNHGGPISREGQSLSLDRRDSGAVDVEAGTDQIAISGFPGSVQVASPVLVRAVKHTVLEAARIISYHPEG